MKTITNSKYYLIILGFIFLFSCSDNSKEKYLRARLYELESQIELINYHVSDAKLILVQLQTEIDDLNYVYSEYNLRYVRSTFSKLNRKIDDIEFLISDLN